MVVVRRMFHSPLFSVTYNSYAATHRLSTNLRELEELCLIAIATHGLSIETSSGKLFLLSQSISASKKESDRSYCESGEHLNDRCAQGGELPEEEADPKLLQEVLVVLPGGHHVAACITNQFFQEVMYIRISRISLWSESNMFALMSKSEHFPLICSSYASSYWGTEGTEGIRERHPILITQIHST